MASQNARSTWGRNFFINRNFAMIWIGGTIARLSEGFLFTTFGLWILGSIAHSQSSAAGFIKGITIVAMLALFALGLIAGVFVDRWKDKKRVLLITSALRAGIALFPVAGALFLSLSPVHAPWMIALSVGSIYLATFLISTLTHFSIPVSYVLFADCVDEEDYSRANGLLLTTSFLGAMFGPPLGILLYFTVGFPGALLFDALLYMGTFVATMYIHIDGALLRHARTGKSFFGDTIDGVAFCMKNSLLTMMLIGLVLINIWNGALSMLGASFIVQNLHTAYAAAPVYVPEGFYGTVGVTIGIGFAVGSLLFGFIARRVGEKRVFSYSLLVAGLIILVISRLALFAPVLVGIFLISFLSMGINVTAVPMYLWVTPRHFLGRVRGIVDLTTNLTAVLAGAGSLWLVNSVLPPFHVQLFHGAITPIDTVFTAAGVLCVLGGLLLVRGLSDSRKAQATPTSTIPEQHTSTSPETGPIERVLEPGISSKL